MSCPDEMYDALALLGSTGRYVIKHVTRRSDNEIAAFNKYRKIKSYGWSVYWKG